MLKKRNQHLYKPGSVLALPVPHHLSKRSTLHRIVNNSGEQPYHDDGLHELAASSKHSIAVTNYLVVSYTTFSPLPPDNPEGYTEGGYFLLLTPTVANSLYFRKWSALRCPDFPLMSEDTSDKAEILIFFSFLIFS